MTATSSISFFQAKERKEHVHIINCKACFFGFPFFHFFQVEIEIHALKKPIKNPRWTRAELHTFTSPHWDTLSREKKAQRTMENSFPSPKLTSNTCKSLPLRLAARSRKMRCCQYAFISQQALKLQLRVSFSILPVVQ